MAMVQDNVSRNIAKSGDRALVGEHRTGSWRPDARLPAGCVDWHGLIGECQLMKQAFRGAERGAKAGCAVLILGETGTGKEHLARAVHDLSARSTGPFVAVNSTEMPEGLFETGFFGHERGAYTGAERARKGVFEEAHRGTVFLDEVGDLAPGLQTKLLRVLEDRLVRPLGGVPVRVDFHVIAATNVDLGAMVTAGRFRADLFHRLNEFEIVVPPLRERGPDLGLLVDHFLHGLARDLGLPSTQLAESTRAQLEKYHWPGNVRELRSALRKALLASEGETIRPIDLPREIRTHIGNGEVPPNDRTEGVGLVPLSVAVKEAKAKVEREQVARALSLHGTKEAAARALGINRRTLYVLLERHGVGGAETERSERVIVRSHDPGRMRSSDPAGKD
jgi:transcriptional regulator with PAS, ATPase and Fis domain